MYIFLIIIIIIFIISTTTLHFSVIKVQRIEKSLHSDILHVEIFPNDLAS